MDENGATPVVYQFHSVTNLYKGLPETDLNLEIYEYSSDAVEVKLINTNYQTQKWMLKKQFIYIVSSFYAYCLLFLYKSMHFVVVDAMLILWLLLLIWRLTNLVECEKFIFCYDFGIHLQIQKCLGKSNQFVAATEIHDIVINEVLENLDFRYLLIMRTKGNLFHKKPIIPVFRVFKPSYECLSLIYKYLNKIAIKNKI